MLVVPYDPRWPLLFEALRSRLDRALGTLPRSIEHVGSTSVPGLTAKPILDVDVVVRAEDVPRAREALATLGYAYGGDRGIEGRHAFIAPDKEPLGHNLYVCVEGCLALRNHLALRDRLRRDPALRDRYAALKRSLAEAHADDREGYTAGKTAFILDVLRQEGFAPAETRSVLRANLPPPRRARPEEAAAIAQLFAGSRAAHLPYLPRLHTEAEELGYFRDVVLARDEVWALDDHRGLAGFIAFDAEGWVHHLYVRADAVGRCMGTVLLDHAQNARPRLRLWVFQRNERARRFYERHGFVEVARTDGDNEEREPDVLLEWHKAPHDARG